MNRTVDRTFAILQLIADSKNGITLQEIANEMEMAKSSAFVIVQSLLELNYIERIQNNEKKYRLGLEAFSLGMKYTNDMSLIKQCSLFLPAIAEKYDKTAFVAVLSGTQIVYLYKYIAHNARLTSCSLGTRKDAFATSLGKAIIAFLSEEEQLKLIEQIKFKSFTEKTITTKEEFLEELKRTKERGYSLDMRELESITSCCGAPIFDHEGKVVAAVSLSDIYKKEQDERMLAEELKNVAIQISKSMGYMPK